MTVFVIERQRSNGDWTPVGQIDTDNTLCYLPEHVLEEWAKHNPEHAAVGPYRLFHSEFGSRFVEEGFRLVEHRRWVVEKVKDDPEPAAEPEVKVPEVAVVDVGHPYEEN